MFVKIGVAACVLLFMVAIMAVLARRLRDIPLGHLLINLLFPLSQFLIVAFLLYYALAYDLPDWMFVLVAVIGVLCGPVDLALFKALRESEERVLSRERVRLLEEQLQAQNDYLQGLTADIEESRLICEHVAKELALVDDLLDKREAELASQGLLHAVDIMDSTGKRFCDHRVVDALVSMKAAGCREARIRLELDLAIPDDISLPSVELCAVFSNMLDNAMNACANVAEDSRFISLKAQAKASFFVVRMDNSCAPSTAGERRRAARARGGGLPEHGWGLGILKMLAERHDGNLEIGQADGVFTTTIVLCLSPTPAEG